MGKQGQFTERFGRYLRNHRDLADLQVEFDHGPSEGGAKTIPVYWGDEPRKGEGLSQIDIAVLKPQGDSFAALVLLELEESKLTPKLLLGDVFATLMGEGIYLMGKPLAVGGWTTLLIASLARASKPKRNEDLALNAEVCKGFLATSNSNVGAVRVLEVPASPDREAALFERIWPHIANGLSVLESRGL